MSIKKIPRIYLYVNKQKKKYSAITQSSKLHYFLIYFSVYTSLYIITLLIYNFKIIYILVCTLFYTLYINLKLFYIIKVR